MEKKYKKVRGMHDILPEEAEKWHIFEEIARQVSESFGFKEIKTPVVEERGLFERGVGETTDIVLKEMYCFQDKKGRDLALRPEGTASVVRAYIENQLYLKEKITRLYYIGPMFRYDRPQKGRYRQFYHFGVELFGGKHPYFDGEIIYLLSSILESLKIKNYIFQINSLGCKNCKSKYSNVLKQYFENYKQHLCHDCKIRVERSPLRILDCKNNKCKEISKNIPDILDILCESCKNDFEKVTRYLQEMKINFNINKNLVRGLDYYTKTVFELYVEKDKNAVAGGGRYDNLVEELGGPSTPAVGFAIGIERIIPYIKQKKATTSLYCVFIGEEPKLWAVRNLSFLRKEGIDLVFDYEERNLKNHLKILNRENKKWCIIIGENEVKENKVILKNMVNGQQFEIKVEKILEEIKRKIK